MRVVAALVAAALVAVLAVEGSPASREFASEAFAQGTKFVSKRYGYEVVLSGRYIFHSYATVAWTGKYPFGNRPDVDVFYDGQDRKFVIAAKRLSAGATLRSWQAAHVATVETICEKSRAFRNSTLDGKPARGWVNLCNGYDVITLIALHRGLGYTFQFVSPMSNTAASDRAIFEAGRRAFRFTSR